MQTSKYIMPSAIWTYAANSSETSNNNAFPYACDSGSSSNPPSFVGSNYYCESGNPNTSVIKSFLYILVILFGMVNSAVLMVLVAAKDDSLHGLM